MPQKNKQDIKLLYFHSIENLSSQSIWYVRLESNIIKTYGQFESIWKYKKYMSIIYLS